MLILSAGCYIFKFSVGFCTTTSRAMIVKGSHPPIIATHGRLFSSTKRLSTQLYSAETSDEVVSMRAGDIKKELESYGISTASFVEKSDLVVALQKARADGLKPKEKPKSTTTTSSRKNVDKKEENDTRPREERLQEELKRCQSMKAGELRKELQEIGISTASFFEKSDFVQALAEARVDGMKKNDEEEGYAEYTDVEVLTDDSSGPRQRTTSSNGGSSRQANARSSPFSGGASPFGGGGGGVGGMGGIADLLNNIGMGSTAGSPFGGAGANPFSGMGANPFGGMGGDAMGKAQELMKNPKVMELMRKAQGNPRIMAAMQECMSNPAAFAKYQNDPEVSKMINELRKYM
jgi:hypothetical protein